MPSKRSVKSKPGGISFGNSRVKFVGDDAEMASVSKAGRQKFVPNQRLDWLHDSRPATEPVDLRRLSSDSSLDWVWWCCLQCHNERFTVRFWAFVGNKGCVHEKPATSFASWCRDMGLVVPRKPKTTTETTEEDVWS